MERLSQALSRHTVVGVDTAPLIYLWERHPRYFALSETLFRYLDLPQVQGVTSIITLIEATVLPQRQNQLDLVQAYQQALLHGRQIKMLPIDVPLAQRAVILRAQYGIHVPDALQIAAALAAQATAFVTNDQRLSQVAEIEVLVFDDYLA